MYKDTFHNGDKLWLLAFESHLFRFSMFTYTCKFSNHKLGDRSMRIFSEGNDDGSIISTWSLLASFGAYS